MKDFLAHTLAGLAIGLVPIIGTVIAGRVSSNSTFLFCTCLSQFYVFTHLT